jgi:hypothetical protein
VPSLTGCKDTPQSLASSVRAASAGESVTENVRLVVWRLFGVALNHCLQLALVCTHDLAHHLTRLPHLERGHSADVARRRHVLRPPPPPLGQWACPRAPCWVCRGMALPCASGCHQLPQRSFSFTLSSLARRCRRSTMCALIEIRFVSALSTRVAKPSSHASTIALARLLVELHANTGGEPALAHTQ